jgi:predicted dinucleotide-binding enzyme
MKIGIIGIGNIGGTIARKLKAAVRGDAPKKRDKLPELFAKLGSRPSHHDIIFMNRS